MEYYDEKKLKRFVAENPDCRAFYLAASEPFLLEVCENMIRRSCAAARSYKYDMKQLDTSALSTQFLNMPLLAEPELVVLQNFMPSAIDEKTSSLLGGLFSDIPAHITLVCEALYEDDRFSPAKTCEKLLPDNCCVAALHKKSGAQLADTARSLAKSAGATITPDALRRLLLLCGNDLFVIYGELCKLAAHCGYGEITLNDVDALVPDTVETSVFEIIKAVSRKDAPTAAAGLEQLLAARENPIAICSVLGGNFVNLYRAQQARAAGKSLDEFYKLFGWKRSDIKPKIAYEQSGSYTEKALCQIIGVLCELDGKLKSSRAQSDVLLETALAEILLIVRA